MNQTGSYILAFILAVAVHVGVIGLMMMNWEANREAEITKLDKPFYIEAYALKQNPIEVKKQRAIDAAATRRELARKKRLKKDADKKTALNRQRLEEEKVRLAAEEKARQDALKKPEAVKIEVETEADKLRTEAEETARLALEQEMALEIIFEQDARRAVTDDEKAMAYAAQIKKEIIQNWSRPPSARNGMQAILRVYLVPTGEVVNVVVQESSGNGAFDRSAILAVEKADRFVVPKDNRQFERNFREFEVLFRPEDLRL